MSDDGHVYHTWAQYPQRCAKCRAQLAEQQADDERIHTDAIRSLTLTFTENAREATAVVYNLRRTLAELMSPQVYDIELAEGAEGADALADLDAALRLLRNVERIATWRRNLYPAEPQPTTA